MLHLPSAIMLAYGACNIVLHLGTEIYQQLLDKREIAKKTITRTVILGLTVAAVENLYHFHFMRVFIWIYLAVYFVAIPLAIWHAVNADHTTHTVAVDQQVAWMKHTADQREEHKDMFYNNTSIDWAEKHREIDAYLDRIFAK